MSAPTEPDSLPSTVVALLDRFRIPVDTTAVRIVAGDHRGKPVPAEQLARLASYEREAFLRKRSAPRLAEALDEHGSALRPRVWALGSWRLERRLQTADARPKWEAALAINLCQEVQFRWPESSPAVRQLAMERVAVVLGPHAPQPEAPADWGELARLIAHERPDYDFTAATAGQLEAARRLREQSPELTPYAQYFGFAGGVVPPPSDSPAALRAPLQGETGRPFDEVALDRVGHNVVKLRQLLGYLRGWADAFDSARSEPTTAELADLWHQDLATVKEAERLFGQAFPEERSPARVVALLNELSAQTNDFYGASSVLVVDIAATSGEGPAPQRPAPGQRWQMGNEGVLTLIEVDGDRVVGHLSQHETVSIWVGSLQDVAKLTPILPRSAWWVRFDVDELPSRLIGPLAKHDISVIRAARPSDPRSDGRALRVGTIEAHVVAPDAERARALVIDAMAGTQALAPSDVLVRALGNSAA